MPTVTLNRKVVEKLAGKKLSDEKLKDRISMLGTDLESLDENEIHIEIFPNRPDMLSEQGFARAFSSFLGVKTGLANFDVKPSGEKLIVEKTLPKDWPYAVACIVRGLEFTDERIREVVQIQEKLGMTHLRQRKKGGIGFYPLEKITFPIRFRGENPDTIKFRPLEYPSEITGRQILSKHKTGRTYAHLLEGWKTYPIFEDAKGVIMSMPPVINSHTVGKIDETTTDVFLEITGNDFAAITTAFNIMVTSLADMGGKIYSIECTQMDGTKYTAPNLKPTKLPFDLSYINKRLGLDLTEKEAKELLERMGYGYEKRAALVPAYRADILHQIDLAEDIAIAYGYENFEEIIPKVATIGSESEFEIFKRKLTDILVGLGLLECKTYHITNKDHQTKKMNTQVPLIELANALNEEYSTLASWILPSLMEILHTNKHHEYPQNIFAMGGVFKKGSTETGVVEQERLACVLCQDGADYTRILQVLDYLFRMMNIKYTIKATEHPSFIAGRVGRVSALGCDIAYIGEVSPEVLSNWDLDVPVCGFELNISELFTHLKEKEKSK